MHIEIESIFSTAAGLLVIRFGILSIQQHKNNPLHFGSRTQTGEIILSVTLKNYTLLKVISA